LTITTSIFQKYTTSQDQLFKTSNSTWDFPNIRTVLKHGTNKMQLHHTSNADGAI